MRSSSAASSIACCDGSRSSPSWKPLAETPRTLHVVRTGKPAWFAFMSSQAP